MAAALKACSIRVSAVDTIVVIVLYCVCLVIILFLSDNKNILTCFFPLPLLDEPTKNGKSFRREAGLNKSRSRPMSPVRHGRNGMMIRDADEEEEDGSPTIPNNNMISDNDLATGPNEFDMMVATVLSKDEKTVAAAKKVIIQKQRLKKAHIEQEHRKKKQVEAFLKAEVKQKRQFSAKMKREKQRLDQRQHLQAKALNQAKQEQEKYLGDLERQHQRLVKEKMKVSREERGGTGCYFAQMM